MEELDRAHRRLARGIAQGTPVRALMGVGTVIAAPVAIVIVARVLIWVFAD